LHKIGAVTDPNWKTTNANYLYFPSEAEAKSVAKAPETTSRWNVILNDGTVKEIGVVAKGQSVINGNGFGNISFSGTAAQLATGKFYEYVVQSDTGLYALFDVADGSTSYAEVFAVANADITAAPTSVSQVYNAKDYGYYTNPRNGFVAGLNGAKRTLVTNTDTKFIAVGIDTSKSLTTTATKTILPSYSGTGFQTQVYPLIDASTDPTKRATVKTLIVGELNPTTYALQNTKEFQIQLGNYIKWDEIAVKWTYAALVSNVIINAESKDIYASVNYVPTLVGTTTADYTTVGNILVNQANIANEYVAFSADGAHILSKADFDTTKTYLATPPDAVLVQGGNYTYDGRGYYKTKDNTLGLELYIPVTVYLAWTWKAPQYGIDYTIAYSTAAAATPTYWLEATEVGASRGLTVKATPTLTSGWAANAYAAAPVANANTRPDGPSVGLTPDGIDVSANPYAIAVWFTDNTGVPAIVNTATPDADVNTLAFGYAEVFTSARAASYFSYDLTTKDYKVVNLTTIPAKDFS
jgi:hypothetical protein